MKTYSKTRAIGGSLVVTIPANIVKAERIKENELVEIEIKKTKKDYFGTLKGIGRFTEEDELKGQLEEE
ncbi:AbrB/MazE/SpoVT family DNA-binding domain-containing protein [Candidatus Woesearchaeota archaeon]|nr:AbrB/MazE/SpoVT family DNA-binding domain-containing protein [Candidatus Woesearchaeota archaeon]